MGFDGKIYAQAFECKKRDLHNANVKKARIEEELKTAQPRLAEIENAFGRIGAQLAVATLSGNKNAVRSLQTQSEKLALERDKILDGLGEVPSCFECEKCADTGYVNGKICSCVHALAKKIAYDELKSQIPADNYTFENFNLSLYPETPVSGVSPRKRMEKVFKRCREFTDNISCGENLLLLGGTGLGKTHLSIAIAGSAVKGGYQTVYGSVQNLVNKMANEQFSYSGSSDVSDRILGCDLLIMDDLGAEMNTSFSQSCIYNIINTRLLAGRSTVISTNLGADEIEKLYTPRVFSRISGGYTLLQFLGDDIRQKKAKEKLKK